LTHSLPPLAGAALRFQLRTPPTYWRCEPAWFWRSVPLPHHLLWCVLDGSGRLELDGRAAELGPGWCAVFAPGETPVASHDPRRPLLVFGLHFDVETASGRRPDPAEVLPASRWCRLRDLGLFSALAARSDAAYRRGDRLGVRQAELCVEQILALLWEDSSGPPPGPVDAALDELARDIRREPSRRWTVPELAARAALSRAQFTRRFTARFGLSPARYVARARTDRAHQLLTETSMSVTQVATTLGYTDLGYFSRQYKAHHGHSPRAAR
jgi:AraC family transcriptional regulator of arabinose operon